MQKIPNGSKLLKVLQAKNCSSAHTDVSFGNFLKFIGQKSEKFFAQIPKKFWKEKQKKTIFFRNFYSGHVDRNLRTMPKVSAENPKRFKTLKKFQVTKCSSGHAECSSDKTLKFFGQKCEKSFAQNPKKVLKRKIRKLFLPQFLLWIRK